MVVLVTSVVGLVVDCDDALLARLSRPLLALGLNCTLTLAPLAANVGILLILAAGVKVVVTVVVAVSVSM